MSPRAKIAEIEDAFEDAVIERPAEEQVLLKTKQLLLTPNARLIAELSWLSEVAPRRADELVAMLDRGDASSLLAAIPDLAPLSCANLAAEAASKLNDTRFVSHLVTAHARISATSVLSALNSTRAMAGFARVDASQISEALRTLRSAHARSALSAFIAQNDPAHALAELLPATADPHDAMLKEILREYDHWSSPHLGEIERDIDAAVTSLMAGEDGAVERVNTLLTSWDQLSQPAQLYSQLSGLDEERSLRIYRRVRGHCVDLANNHSRFDEAHAVANVMRELFKELPTAASELKADVDTLARLAVEKQAEDDLAPLISAVASAKKDLKRVVAELKSNGFSAHSKGSIASLHRAFSQAMEVFEGGDHADAPARILRAFALDLNNEHDDPAAALALLKGLTAISTPIDSDLADAIATDMRVSQGNIDHRALTKALEAKKHGEALQILDLMIARNPDREESAQLTALQNALKQQRNKRNLKFGGWAAAIAFGLYLVTQEGGDSTSSSNVPEAISSPVESTASPALDDSAVAAPIPDDAPIAPPDPVAADGAATTDVSMPPVGTDHELNGSQVRYCTYEKARLVALNDMVSDTSSTAIDGFNAKVDDYNSRCGSFRYHASDLEDAKALAERDADRIAAEARAIADSWIQ